MSVAKCRENLPISILKSQPLLIPRATVGAGIEFEREHDEVQAAGADEVVVILIAGAVTTAVVACLLYTSPSPRD